MNRKLLTIVVTAVAWLMPVSAADSSLDTTTLRDLKFELHTKFVQLPQTQTYYDEVYDKRHTVLQNALHTSEGQSLLLYTQESHMTFNMAYVLKKVTTDYKDFDRKWRTYDQDINTLEYHTERYTRLIETLQRLPQEKDDTPDYRDSCIRYA